jgi:AraC family transcriptional regulator, transcriptional activator of pobA
LDIFVKYLDKTYMALKGELLNFEGLYGDNTIDSYQEFVHFEKLEIRSEPNNWLIKQHFHHKLFQIFNIESGNGVILFEKREIPFASPCIICIPESSPHGFRFEANSIGTVLTFSVSLLDKICVDSPNIKLEFGRMFIIFGIENEGFFSKISTLNNLLKAEMDEPQFEKNLALKSIITLLITVIFRHSFSNNKESYIGKNRSLAIFNIFQKSIIQSRNPQKNIEEYAVEQNISSVHLNRVCREIASNTANSVINSYFIIEAQKYLLHTDYSISEVAYQLNFNDAAYFSRLFKKNVGINPKEFRNAQKQLN